jgi:hypothetical protein
MGGLMQIYAGIAAGDVIFAEVIVIRGLEHDTIIIVSQMIAGEIIIIAVLQQNAHRTIIDVIHPKVIALGQIKIYATCGIFVNIVLCNGIVAPLKNQHAKIAATHNVFDSRFSWLVPEMATPVGFL